MPSVSASSVNATSTFEPSMIRESAKSNSLASICRSTSRTLPARRSNSAMLIKSGDAKTFFRVLRLDQKDRWRYRQAKLRALVVEPRSINEPDLRQPFLSSDQARSRNYRGDDPKSLRFRF